MLLAGNYCAVGFCLSDVPVTKTDKCPCDESKTPDSCEETPCKYNDVAVFQSDLYLIVPLQISNVFLPLTEIFSYQSYSDYLIPVNLDSDEATIPPQDEFVSTTAPNAPPSILL